MAILTMTYFKNDKHVIEEVLDVIALLKYSVVIEQDFDQILQTFEIVFLEEYTHH